MLLRTTAALCLLLTATHAAAADHFEPGDALPSFRLKTINPEAVGGLAFVDLGGDVGADAATPKKAVLLTFFATYCEPCKAEMPYLAALYDAYKDKGLQVVSVSIDKEQDKVEYAHTLGRNNHVTFPMLSDHFNIVAKRYMINKLPSVYLADSAGKVLAVNIGFKEDATTAMHAQIRQALGLTAADPTPAALAPYLETTKK